MIVISPWARPNFVSHTTRDYTSILRLIEDTFVAPATLPAGVNPWLTLRDKNADNMMEFFDFSAGPQLLNAPVIKTQPTSGVCKNSQEKAPGF